MESVKLIKMSMILTAVCLALCAKAEVSGLPEREMLSRPFGADDRQLFARPPKVFYPETWFHYISGNVSEKGITADLEAISDAGFSGIQMFHGHFSDNVWPGVDKPIACLSPLWNEALRHTGEECSRLGLRFTMQNCPGWAMSGGPWIEPKDAMRHIVYSRTDIDGGRVDVSLPVPQPSGEDWRDYRDVAVLAFPTPEGDTGRPLMPESVASDMPELPWMGWLSAVDGTAVNIPPSATASPHWVEVTFPDNEIVRTLELPCVQGFNHAWCFEPGVSVTFKAEVDGAWRELFRTDLPQSSWQDGRPMTLACPELPGGARKYRLEISNLHDMNFNMLRMYSAARSNNWEAEAGWTLRAIERKCDAPQQSPESYVSYDDIKDISGYMTPDGKLSWNAPAGKWTVLRIGHVNSGERNGPAPTEGTGWECDKLSKRGSDVHFANYIGRLSDKGGPVGDGILKGMLMDSWECRTQTWTDSMEFEFERVNGYELRRWMPALFGYVVDDPETTACMLHDWKRTVNDLIVENFYGNMARKAHARGLTVAYETAGGDVVPVDIMEYFKHADIPMCEFWQPLQDNFVGSLNFKPIKPTASAARMYGKPRVAAEAFTSFSHTWDEHLWQLKEVANVNCIEGVTHLVFHTYTHNPQVAFLPPGTSFGGQGIGTPFLRGQTWWKHMPEFTSYLARCTYMLERGLPVSDVLWYLGDEFDHKPDQNAPFPNGYKYDYCNTDALLNRISVEDGMLVTPEGISYRVLWIPDSHRLLPATMEKLYALVSGGATVIASAPASPATLAVDKKAKKRFSAITSGMWPKGDKPTVRKVGKGRVLSGYGIGEALEALDIAPDVSGGNAMWLHRRADNADWYFVCAPKDSGFDGRLSFRASGDVEIWNPVTGSARRTKASYKDGRADVDISLPRAGSCFIMFYEDSKLDEHYAEADTKTVELSQPWTVSFPSGWGAPEEIELSELKAWKDLDISAEGKAFSGTAVYTTSFDLPDNAQGVNYTLDLGDVDMVAVVKINGETVRTLWTPPFSADITDYVCDGRNELTVEVTSSWFNRLAYDASLPESERKTWAIKRPDPKAPLRSTGLLGPVVLRTSSQTNH